MRIEPFKLERYFAKHEFTAKHLLCSSDCESLSLGELLDLEPEARSRFEKLWLGYTESAGSPSLREQVAQLYSGISANQILVHAGAEEAIFNFMNVLLSAGDHVIVHTPCYQSLVEIPRALGCEVTEWRAHEENGWALEPQLLKKAIRPNTRLVIINTPHNPTGYLASRETLEEIVRICRQAGAALFCDEVYQGLELDPKDRLPAACELYEKAYSLGVMSKAYGLAGLRIGWIASQDQATLQKTAAFKDYVTICSSAPSEFLATLALKHRERIVGRNLKIIRSNLDLLDRFFEEFPELLSWRRPTAGSIAFPGWRGKQEIAEFCDELVDQTGVLLLPGTLFEPGLSHFRIGFGRKAFSTGLEKFASHLQAKRKRGGV